MVQWQMLRTWQEKLSDSLRLAIEEKCCGGEIACVRAIVDALNGNAPLKATDAWSYTAEAAFLHGPISKVQFGIGGKLQEPRELADLVVLAAEASEGRVERVRACFIQTKANHKGSDYSASYSVDDLQLWLLSTFPNFDGLGKMIKGHNFRMRNRTGMLGAYGLLAHPGEISILSARVLANVLSGDRAKVAGKSISTRDLAPTFAALALPQEVDVTVRVDCDHRLHSTRYWTDDRRGLSGGSRLATLCLEDFVKEWTGLHLGELWEADPDRQSDPDLKRFIDLVVARARMHGQLSEFARVLGPDVPTQEPDSPGQDEPPSQGVGVLALVRSWSQPE